MRMLKQAILGVVLFLGAALIAPAAQAQCAISHSVTYVDVWVGSDGGTIIEITIYVTMDCHAGTGGGGGSVSGVYQYHSHGRNYWWFWSVGGQTVSSGGNQAAHDLSADNTDDPEVYVPMPEIYSGDDPREIAPPPD